MEEIKTFCAIGMDYMKDSDICTEKDLHNPL